jgi:SPX domain protein involved in polyphosphate accumulation
MKFGKDLEQYKHPEWEDEYMNYQMLKDILRKLESQAKVRLDCDCPT